MNTPKTATADDEAAALDALRRLCPGFTPHGSPLHTETSLLISGALNGRAAVAKYPIDPRPFWRERCRHEIAMYRAIASLRPPVTIPRLLAAEPGDLLLVMQRLPGQPVTPDRWPQSPIHPTDLTAMIATLRALHAWSPDQAAFPAVFDDHEQLERFHRQGPLTRGDRDLLGALFAEVIETAGWEFNHGDAHPGNVVAAPGGDCALVDLEFTGLHVPAFDWALLWAVLQTDAPARRQVIAAAGLHNPTRRKAFLLNAVLVLVREIESHHRHPVSAVHRARLRRLERDLRLIRQQLRRAAAPGPSGRGTR